MIFEANLKQANCARNEQIRIVIQDDWIECIPLSNEVKISGYHAKDESSLHKLIDQILSDICIPYDIEYVVFTCSVEDPDLKTFLDLGFYGCSNGYDAFLEYELPFFPKDP